MWVGEEDWQKCCLWCYFQSIFVRKLALTAPLTDYWGMGVDCWSMGNEAWVLKHGCRVKGTEAWVLDKCCTLTYSEGISKLWSNDRKQKPKKVAEMEHDKRQFHCFISANGGYVWESLQIFKYEGKWVMCWNIVQIFKKLEQKSEYNCSRRRTWMLGSRRRSHCPPNLNTKTRMKFKTDPNNIQIWSYKYDHTNMKKA